MIEPMQSVLPAGYICSRSTTYAVLMHLQADVISKFVKWIQDPRSSKVSELH